MSAAPRRIPRAPLVLGLAGLLPFLWGALTAHLGSFGTEAFLGERLIGLAALSLLRHGDFVLHVGHSLGLFYATHGSGRNARLPILCVASTVGFFLCRW